MKLSNLKPRAALQRRQELWRRDRAAAPTLRTGFPRVERIQIDLGFEDRTPYTPVRQSHVLHPAAQAFFSFPCPYADCDGRFDLDAIVREALASSAQCAQGSLQCTGHRARDRASGQPCGLQLHFSIVAHYGRECAPAQQATAST
jgi:hypothetical protein